MRTRPDPIEDLKRAAEIIRASTGERPELLLVPASLWDRLEAHLAEQRRLARQGIDD